MKIKTNIRAGSGTNTGGASGAGHNSTLPDSTVVAPPPAPVVYYPPATRCAGY